MWATSIKAVDCLDLALDPPRNVRCGSRSLRINANLPSSSLERDFCRRRQARQKRPEDDISEQRPEIGDHHSREMAAEMAFLLASYQLRVSEDWVVGAPGLEPVTPTMSK